MPGSGIWLDPETYLQTAGQLWAQDQQQRVQAGSQWAQQAMQQALQPVQDSLSKLQQMVPQVPTTPTPPPAAQAPPVAPPPEPTPTLTPPPTPPVPIGGTPVAAPGPPMPGTDMGTAGITPPPAPTAVAPAPTPTPAPSIADVGQTWAQQQIANLLNPSAPQPSSTATPTPPALTPALAPPVSAPPSPATALPDQSQAQGGLTPAPPPDRSMSLQDYARAAAQRAGIDPNVFTAQIQQESGFNPNARSPVGAQGIAQFMPATAQGIGLDSSDPYASLDAAAKMDAQKLQDYGGDWGKTLASYNAGPGAVAQYGGVPPFQETQDYVKTILGNAQQAAAAAGTTISNTLSGGIDTAKQAVGNAISTGQTAVNNAVQGVQSAVARTSQFGMGLSSGDAYSFCGPTAAIAFAQTYGRNPTVDEAKQLAQQVGWNPSTGMAGAGSEVKLLNAMGVDAHMTNGVDWANVGRDASGGNPVIIDTPGHYYYVDGYNQQTGQLHVGTSGTDLKGGSEWMTPDQINAMPQSGGSARAAIFADHPLAQQDGLAQSAGQTFMGGLQDAAGNVLANAPLPFIGQSANQLTDQFAQTQHQLQQTQNLVGGMLGPDQGIGGMLTSDQGTIQNKANDVLQAVQDVGGQAMQAGQNILQQGQQAIGAAPQTVSTLLNQNAIGDNLNLNALGQAPLPMGGQVSDLTGLLGQGQQALGGLRSTDLNGLLSQAGTELTSPNLPSDVYRRSPTAWFNQQLGSLGPALTGGQTFNASDLLQAPENARMTAAQALQNMPAGNIPVLSGLTSLGTGLAGGLLQTPSVMDSMQTIQDLTNKYADSPGAGSVTGAGGQRLTIGVDPSVMTPEDRDAYNQAMIAVGGIASPISAGDWAKGFYRGGIISSPATMADVAMNSGAGPIISTLTGAIGDVLHGTAAPGRLTGRALGTATGISQWASQFLDALRPSSASPTSLVGRAAPGLERGAAYAAEGWGMTHGAFQQATQNLISQQELGTAAGQAASKVATIGTSAWRAAYDAFMTSPPADAVAAAQAEGARISARAEPGWLTGKLGQLAGGGPGGQNALQTALFPVYRMGMNMAARAVEASPVGAVGTAIDAARGLLGQGPYARGLLSQPATNTVAPLARRLMTNALGTAFTAYLVKEGMEGNINGSWAGLTPAEQDSLRAQGMAPDTFRGPDGNWYGWDKAPPQVRGALIAAGAYVDATHAYQKAQNLQQSSGPQAYGLEDPRGAALRTLFNEVGTQLANATPLRTFASTYDMLTGGGQQDLRSLVDIPSSVLGGLVPESGFERGVSQMTDPSQRQVLQPKTLEQVPTAIQQNVQQNLPGLREQLPARLDVLGRQVANPLQGLSSVLPLRAAAGQPSPVLSAMASAGVAPSAAPPSIPYGPNAQINLRPEEQQTYERYRGQMIQQMASDLVNSPDFQQMPDYAQKIALQRVSQTAGEVAGRMLLADLAPDAQNRMSLTGVLAPVQSYGPSMLDQATMFRNQASHRALIQALLSQQAG